MDYKEKYEQALERCKEEFNFNNLAYSHEEIKQKLKRVFPELGESENEKIIVLLKNIIKYLDNEGLILPLLGQDCDHEEYAKILAWLEKQGEKKPAWSEEDEKECKRVVGLLEGWSSTFKETYYAEDCKCGISWLNSLKQRMKGE